MANVDTPVDPAVDTESGGAVNMIVSSPFGLPASKLRGGTILMTKASTVPGETITPCSCCGATPDTHCRLTPCVQCPTGYASYEIETFQWKYTLSPPVDGVFPDDIWINFVWDGPGIVLYPSVRNGAAMILHPAGDCVWEGVGYNGYFFAPFFPRVWYCRLYYSSGWKLFVDYSIAPNPTGLIFPPKTYTPSGNGFVIALDAFSCIGAPRVESNATILTQPAATHVTINGQYFNSLTGSTQTDFDITDFIVNFNQCGSPVMTTDCCTEKVPTELMPVANACIETDPALASVGFGWTTGMTWVGTLTGKTGAVLTDYFVVLSCETPNWRLKIYAGPGATGTLYYNALHTTLICYPIYLKFTGISLPGACGGTAFDLEITA